jgi:type I restriction enzyme, S subunit
MFKIVGGGTPSTSRPEFWNGSIPWITSADIDDHHHVSPRRTISHAAIENSATNLVPRGSVIVVTRVGLGKVGLAPADMCFSQDSQALLFSPDVLDPWYVVHYMGQAVSVFKHIGRGTTINGVTKRQLVELPFLIAPLREQSRIVAEIEKQFTRLEAAVAALKRVRTNLKRYRASVLKAACEGGLVPTEAELARTENRTYESADKLLARILKERRACWEADQLAKMQAAGKPPKDDKWKAKYKEPAPPDTSGLPPLPEGWCSASLEQLTSAVRVICYGILMPKENVTSGVLYVRVVDIRQDRIALSQLRRTSREIAESYRRASLRSGDLLLAIRGSFGRVAQVPAELDGGNITQDTARLDVNRLADRRYVAHCLRSWSIQNYFKRVARGVAVKGVNIADVRTCPVTFPPVAEQRRIAAEVERRLSVIDELEGTVNADLKRTAGLRQAILKRAFQGKLVPQDPSDEPASILLERIRGTATPGCAALKPKASKAQARVPVPRSL